MTTMYDVHDLENQVSHLVGESKDARLILKEYLAEHTSRNNGKECHCHECTQARAWLARNK